VEEFQTAKEYEKVGDLIGDLGVAPSAASNFKVFADLAGKSESALSKVQDATMKALKDVYQVNVDYSASVTEKDDESTKSNADGLHDKYVAERHDKAGAMAEVCTFR
jgi:hypothetical protein